MTTDGSALIYRDGRGHWLAPSDPDFPGNDNPIRRVQVEIFAADLAAFNSAPKVIVPPQGVGLWSIPIAAAFQFTPGTVPFDASSTNVSLQYEDGGGGMAAFGNPTFNFDVLDPLWFTFIPEIGGLSMGGAQPEDNTSLLLVGDVDLGGGDGSGRITVIYHVVELA